MQRRPTARRARCGPRRTGTATSRQLAPRRRLPPSVGQTTLPGCSMSDTRMRTKLPQCVQP
jgi:hypothetical protein